MKYWIKLNHTDAIDPRV